MQDIDIAAEAADPAVAALDLSALDAGDLVNLILQRSEVLFDLPRPGRIIRAWNEGDEGPIREAVARLGHEIARRAAGVIHAEYRNLAPAIRALAPRRIADIGCGYAFFDLFAARDTGAELLLIDLETNERRHFGFAREGAAYSNLSTAARLLAANGIAPGGIRTLNPAAEDPMGAPPVDLAVSLLSCGFHYPVSTYAGYFRDRVSPGGAILLDLRRATEAEQWPDLAGLGEVEDFPTQEKARRVLIRRG
jgi:SAM-dependent methyltransferase